MKRFLILLAAVLTLGMASAQTLNVQVGNVIYRVPAYQAEVMNFADGATLTILGKTFPISDIEQLYVDNTTVTDNVVDVTYNGTTASVAVPANLMSLLDVSVSGADVSITQAETLADEVTYTLSGNSTNGSFTMAGQLKSTVVLNGLTLTSTTGAPLTINNGKRINIEVADGTTNTLVDAASGAQKACFFVKGHAEFSGGGTLNITGNAKHAYRSNEYTLLKKKFTGKINILGAASDGFHVEEYFQQNAGEVTITGIDGDGIQVDYATDDDGNIEESTENTGEIILKDGKISITTTAAACKGLKAEGNVQIQGGTLEVTQSGDLEVTDDLSYSTAVKSDADINITGGTININNTAAGGKGLSADGNVNIDETNATTIIDITANGKGGTAETTSSGETTETPKSYKVYVSIPTGGSGGGPGGGMGGNNAWKKVYLYKGDGTLVQQLTSTVSKSSGYSTITFYYYDFKTAGDGTTTYYFKADDYTSGGYGGGTTYTIRSASFTAPTDGQDIYYSITNSYSTSGTTRTYQISDVTTSYGGTSDLSEDSGTSYNASGIKADGNITIASGTVTVKNSGAMSKSLKSKATATISGGTVTLTPSGAMQVINSDASYSSGIKAADFLMSGGTLEINASGAAGKGISVTNMTQTGGTITMKITGTGQTLSNNRYTAKGIKTDGNLNLSAGNLNITTTQAGTKGIKVNGTYTQGTSNGEGPTVYVSTSGARFGTSSSSGGWGGGGMGGKTTGQGGAAKAIKSMGAVVIYGGNTEIHTAADGGEGLESRTSIDIRGGQHYLATYDDCISTTGTITFNGGVTVAYSNGNDAVDSNYGRTGAITIGNGTIFAFSTKGGAEEGLDCDNNSYIQITGKGIAISAGGSQGGGGGWGGGSSSISGAAQGYYLSTSSVSYSAGRYYTLADSSGKNLVTYSFPASLSSNLSLLTATGMVKGSSYTVKYSTTAPTDATTAFHGLYLGSSATGTSSVMSFTAQ